MRLRSFSYAFGFAGLWVIVALVRAGTTFHLAPLIVAVAGVGSHLGRDVTGRDPWTGVLAGTTAALTGTGLLAAAGRLDGPSLLPVGGAVAESLVAAALGTLVAIVLAVVSARRSRSNVAG